MSHLEVDITCVNNGTKEATTTICSGELRNTSSTALFIERTPNPQVFMRFTAGEVMISLFLFLILMTGLFSLFWFGIIKPHIHRIHLK